MNGYLLNFYKHSPLRNDILEDPSKRNKFNNEFVRNIVWSTFDRLEIRKINEFRNFRTSSDSEKKWVGERQFSMIYDVCDDGSDRRLIYKEDSENTKCRFAFSKNNTSNKEMNNYRFFGISMIDFTEIAYDSFFSLETPVKCAREVILKTLDELLIKNNIPTQNMCFDVFGCLGGNDIVIIWLSNQFDELITLVESLRCSKINNSNTGIISNVYTVVGLRDIENKSISYRDVRGNLNIRLTKRDGHNFDLFREALLNILKLSETEQTETFKNVAGEYDLSINISANKLVSELYQANGLFHMGQDIFYKNFIQANTELSSSYNKDNINTTNIHLNIAELDNSRIKLCDSEIYDLVNEICSTDMLQKTPYLSETLWILYADYLKNITSLFSYPWTQDLHYQFKCSLQALKSIINNCDTKLKKYNDIEFIIKNLRQIILHVSQANRIFFEVPNTHLKHTGTYSKILRAYQGIVKILINQAYLIPKNRIQSQIIPFVTFDTIPIPTSEVLEIPEEKMLLIEMKLPFEALTDIPHYTFLLAHEVYHYIAPTDREYRNELVAIMLLSTISKNVLSQYIIHLATKVGVKEKLDIKESLIKKLLNLLETNSKNYIIDNFDSFKHNIPNYNSDNRYINFISSLCRVYINDISSEQTCKLFFNILTDYNYREIYTDITTEEKKQIENLIEHISALNVNDDFYYFRKWTKESLKVKTITSNSKFIHCSLREAMADFYMIQIMKMDFSKYIEYILKNKDLVSNSDNDLMQGLRLTMVYNYCFVNSNQRLAKIGTKDWSSNVELLLSNSNSLKDEEKEYISKTIFSNYKLLEAYDDLLFEYFELLRFDRFGNLFENPLSDSQKRIIVNKGDDFETNTTYVEKLQKQEPLELLCQNINTISTMPHTISCIKSSDSLQKTKNTTTGFRTAENFRELLDYIGKAAKTISDSDFDEIWYRGHSNFEYKLIPSLYRMKNNTDLFYNTSLRETMESLFKFFKIKSFNAPEIFDGGNDTIASVMASMQHYSVPTNILDWTPAVLNAIYFAVEKYINSSDDITDDTKDCEIWLLNPVRMNEQLFNPKMDAPKTIYPIPSILGDETKHKEYFPLSDYPKINDHIGKPMAIYVPYSNQRIKAQFGTFTIFSLDVEKQPNEKGKNFSNYDLFKIHEEENKCAKSEQEFKPFLMRVRIASSAIRDIVRHLKIMGIHKHVIYPELENISKDITNHVREYLDRNGR